MTISDLKLVTTYRGWMLDPPEAPPAPLTRRESEVMEAVLSGRTHKEVAFDLGISDATVRVLYARAMKKLGWRKPPRPPRTI